MLKSQDNQEKIEREKGELAEEKAQKQRQQKLEQ
jgi:hypothetical protein